MLLLFLMWLLSFVHLFVCLFVGWLVVVGGVGVVVVGVVGVVVTATVTLTVALLLL